MAGIKQFGASFRATILELERVQRNASTTQGSNAAISPIAPSYNTTGMQPLESVMNFSFGLQQNVGFGTVVDASYVGVSPGPRMCRSAVLAILLLSMVWADAMPNATPNNPISSASLRM